jgi:hypothetical protein
MMFLYGVPGIYAFYVPKAPEFVSSDRMRGGFGGDRLSNGCSDWRRQREALPKQ